MPYFNYNNAKISITGQAFMAESVGISLQNSISPKILLNRRSSDDYVAEDGVKGALSLRYYLTGIDPLKNFIKNEKDSISVNFNGLGVQSGYLTSYSFEASPYSPVLIDAEISFFDNVTGSFFASAESNSPPNFSTFNSLSFDVSGLSMNDNSISFSYKYGSTIEPLYKVGQVAPGEIRFLEKSQNLSIKSYSLENTFSYTGKFITASINVGSESYGIKGLLTSKDTSVGFGEKIITSLEVNQNTYGNKPIVTGVMPSSIAMGGEITISGDNLSTVTAVVFSHNLYSTNIILSGDKLMKVKVPNFARSGTFSIINLAGETRVPQDSSLVTNGYTDGIKIT